ncbi:ETC complex I subunit CYBJADRAFT_186276 [Cyberlindnera jadinii NRRL Y-1542]|nr:hypothetical protein CYBJADRAFT_186276 [Cyberlindnera jadinii NRRL Y-1542]ODV72024.1 hypothetical protein CYBJADRAFT_186276 [Cyberlindnera jadinii NRRL Y-1542]
MLRQFTPRPCVLRSISQTQFRAISKAAGEVVQKQEEHGELPKELISGAPLELITERVVRIFKDAKPATQSGNWGQHFWKLDWDVLGKGNRWENDLIGYQSSGDYMQGTIMKFDTKEAAIKFAQGQGWSFIVEEPNVRRFKQKDYSRNFYHSKGKLKHVRTK